MSEIEVPAVQSLVDAINAGDIDGFVAAFTDDGIVDDWGRVLHGADGVRSWGTTDAIGVGARMTVTEATTDQATTHLRFEWSSDKFNGTSEAYVTVSDGLVAEFRIPSH